MTQQAPGNANVQADDWDITTNSESQADLETTHGVTKDEKPDLSKAASELGKKGGKAAAEKRAKEKPKGEESEDDDEEKPIPKATPAKETADDEADKAKGKPKPKGEPEEEEREPEKEAAKADERGEGEGDESNPDKPLAHPRHDLRARVHELSQINRQRDAELQQEREQRRRLEQRLEALERGERPAPRGGDGADSDSDRGGERQRRQEPSGGWDGSVPDDPRPKTEDYESHEAYLDDRDAWNDRRRERVYAHRRNVETQATTYVDTHVREMEEHGKRIEEAIAADPTLNEKVDPRIAYPPTWALPDGQAPGPLNYLANEFIRSKQGPHAMAYLSQHTDVLEEILRESLEAFKQGHSVPDCHERAKIAIARGVAYVEAELKRAKAGGGKPKAADERPEVSRSKPPAKTVTASSHSSEDERAFADDTDYDEHVSIWSARDKRKRA